MLAIDDFRGVICVTVAYFVLYYAYLIRQSFTRIAVKRNVARADKKDGKKLPPGVSRSMAYLRNDPRVVDHPKVVAADRTAMNFLEQMPPFLVTLWLHAAFVDAGRSTLLGTL